MSEYSKLDLARAYLSAIGRKGGKSKSAKKIKACIKNLKARKK